MKSLSQMFDKGGETKRFVETFVGTVHLGRWDQAEDHWERTVAEFLHDVKEMEQLPARQATEEAQRLAMAQLWYVAKRWRSCPWCS